MSRTWFAPRGIETARNIYFRARTQLHLTEVPETYELKIAAESWYRLWCNNQEVATGPARGTRVLTFYDTLNLAPFLNPGENTLEVLVTSAGIPTFKAAPIRPALWIETGDEVLSWQVAIDTSFDSASPLYTHQIGFCEWRDLRVNQWDWESPEYFALNKQLLPRDCAPLVVSRYFAPNAFFPAALAPGESFVLDFNREVTGGAEIDIDAPSGTVIEVAYAEHIEDGHITIRYPDATGEKGNTFSDRYTMPGGRQQLGPTLQERGFRFLEIINRGDAAVTVHGVQDVDRRYPLPPVQLKFADKKIQRLYEVAHHTLSSNGTDVIADCPWREAASWLNDMVVNVTFWLAAGGEPALISRCLRLALSERNPAGLIYGVCPNGDKEDIVFLATNAFLPLILKELAAADPAALEEFLPPIAEIMDALTQFGDADGLLAGPPEYWNFLEWSFNFNDWEIGTRVSASINWFYLLALDAMAELTAQTGGDPAPWQSRAQRVMSALNARFWNADLGHYREFEGEEKVSEIAQALACISKRDEQKTQGLAAKLASEDSGWLTPELYMHHFVLRALIENGYHEAAKARLYRYWGSMLDAGSPTFWEANVHQHGAAAFGGWGSLCHTFSCTPLWCLPRLYSQI